MQLLEKLYNKTKNLTIALDGPSASGKGLIGNMLADEFSLIYVQSSIVYRGLAYLCLKKNISVDDIDSVINLSKTEAIISQITNIDLNTEIIGDIASKISVHNKVRQNLGKYLKKLIKTTPRIIMEGRDIGTIIAPDADLKIFITANVEVRAERRYKQLLLKEKNCRLSDVLELLQDRDKRDSQREAAPLKPAEDAFIIDASYLTPLEVIQKIKEFVYFK